MKGVVLSLLEWWKTLFSTTSTCLFCPTPIRTHRYAKLWKQLCSACQLRLQVIDSPFCQVCGRVLKQAKTNICSDCYAVHPVEWVYNRSVFEYNPFVKQLIWRYKYRGQEKLAEPLGWFMAEILEQHWGRRKFTLTYVPLHQHRLSERGFNQAERLASVIGKTLRLPVMELLVRNRMTHRQSEKGRRERLSSLVGAFSIKTGVDLKQLHDRDILLVDDIYTTGATLRECSKPFKRQGVKTIYSITIAR